MRSAVWRRSCILAPVASTAVVDYSVLDHARAATNHIATDWVDTATHRAGGYQAWIVVGSCSRGWAFDDAATTAAAACGAAAAIGAITACAPATSAADVTSTGGGTSSAHSTCPSGPTSAVPPVMIALSAGGTGRQVGDCSWGKCNMSAGCFSC